MTHRLAPSNRLIRTLLFVTLLVTLVAAAAACAPKQSVSYLASPVVPADADLSTPEDAVRSYLDWVSLAYRLVNSDVSTQTHTPMEGVRVDSYIQLNRENGRGIEQYLDVFEKRGESVAEPTATVSAHEEWRYRYFSLESLEYLGPELKATYDTTYTVVLTDGSWLVDEVEATPLTQLE